MNRRKSRFFAPACVYFGQAANEKGHRQLAVWAECAYAGTRVGPVWGHVDASVRRVLATLTSLCQCGRPYHKSRYYEGRRVVTPSKRRSP